LRYQGDPELKKTFYREIYPKILPSRSMMEELADRYVDDGRKQLKSVEEILNRIGEPVGGGE
jgi:hypothetical protein